MLIRRSKLLVLAGAFAFLGLPGLGSAQELPLKPGRTIAFSTDEGTWISLDVSPDGKMIIFDLLGQLYTMPITGGQATKITGGMGFYAQPRFSPDGRSITFTSDASGAENVWIADADGRNLRQVSQDQHAEFSSPAWLDGRQIVVSRRSAVSGDAAFELWQYDVDGGSGVRITSAKEEGAAPLHGESSTENNAVGPVASKDARFVYFTKRNAKFDLTPGFLNIIPQAQIVRLDRATGEQTLITESTGSAFRPWLSPDGKKLVYGTRLGTETALKVIDLRTRDERWLAYPVQHDDEESEYGASFSRDILPGYAFTPEGKDIVVSFANKIYRVDVDTGKRSVIPFTAQISQGFGPSLAISTRVKQGPVKWRVFQGASQSPDGSRLCFSAATHVYAMNVGGVPGRLTQRTEREYQPVFSPDGRWIAYVTWGAQGGQIWKVRSVGGQPIQLSRIPAYYRDLAWSPDGSLIVALRAPRYWQLTKPNEFYNGRQMLELVAVSAQGGEATTIAAAGDAYRPHFVAAQPDRVYVFTKDGLVSMHLDGSDTRTLVKITGGDDAQISPDGRWIAARASDRVYLFPAPAFGGTPVTVDLAPDSFSKTVVPVRKVTGMATNSVGWSKDSSHVLWTVGMSLFREPVSEAWSGTGKPQEIAVDLTFPRDTPKGLILLRGAKTITMRGDEVIENADILVRDNRISKIGARSTFDIPADAKVVDVSGSTIVPGFIDLHAHYFDIRRDVLDPDNNWDFAANLAYGVTTGRDPQTASFDTLAYQDLVDMGEEVGPRAYSTGPGIFAPTDFQSYAETRDYLATYKTYYGIDYLKNYLTGNRRQRQWVVQASKELGIMPTTEGHSDTELDLTHLIDGFSGLEHSMPVYPLGKDVIEAMKQADVTYTPTLVVSFGGPLAEDYFYEHTEVQNDPKLRRFVPNHMLDAMTRRRPIWSRDGEYVFERLAADDKKLTDAGARVTIGSHGQLQGMSYHWELWLLASGGMSPMQVLRSATIRGAEALGLNQDLGSIEDGKLADLVILAKDPLQDIHNTNTIQYVMKNGRLYKGDTLDEILPVPRSRPKSFRDGDAPTLPHPDQQ